jgi:hypothetical protein
MPNVVATHPVGNMETWLAGGADRAKLFAPLCKSYRVFLHPDQQRISIHFEGLDLAAFQVLMQAPESKAAQARHTVLEPIDMYLEDESAR